jgi:hypothetical protein
MDAISIFAGAWCSKNGSLARGIAVTLVRRHASIEWIFVTH